MQSISECVDVLTETSFKRAGSE